MSVNHYAYTFIGAKVPEEHFYSLSDDALVVCRTHGPQEKAFCGDCGSKCVEKRKIIWTPAMLSAAETLGTTPEELWGTDINPEDQKSPPYYGPESVGYWPFGWEGKNRLFGLTISNAASDEVDPKKNNVSFHRLQEYITQIEAAFKIYGIEAPIEVITCMSAG